MLADRLFQLGVAVVLDPPEPNHTPVEAREAADEILSRPEYQEPEPSLMERIQDAIGELFADLLNGLSIGGVLPQFVAWLLLLGLVAGIVALVAWGVRSGGWGRAPRVDQGDAVILEAERHRSPKDWLAEAVRHESQGRWREGVLCRYRALVTELVQRNVIAELVGRTAGEYVQDVTARRPDVAPTFATATDLFERVWYGGEESGPTERDRFIRLADDTLAAVAAGRASTPTGSPGQLQGAS
jgi:hypothetical protein